MTERAQAARLADAALLGGVGGLRSAMPFAVLALRGRFGSGRGRAAALAAAGGELLADKHPRTPARSSPGPLAGRLMSGAVAGRLLSGSLAAALAGAAAAGATAFAGERLRAAIVRRSGLADASIAVGEDAVAIGIALVATRRLARG